MHHLSTLHGIALVAMLLATVVAALTVGSSDPFKQADEVRSFFLVRIAQPFTLVTGIAWGRITKGLGSIFASGGSLGIVQRDAGDAPGDEIQRDITLVRSSMNIDERSIKGILSTENPVRTYFRGDVVEEILDHSDSAIDLSRAEHGLPLLYSHDRDRQIGVIRNIQIENRQLVGTLIFSSNAFAQEVFRDVKDGIRNHLSISAERVKVEESEGSNVIRTMAWKPFEASVVSVPGDIHATIRRDDTGGGNVLDFKAQRDKLIREGEKAGAERERKRQMKIREIFGSHVSRSALISDLMDDCIIKGDTVERAAERLLDALGQTLDPISRDYQQDSRGGSMDAAGTHSVRAAAGADVLDKFVEGATIGIMARAGMLTTPEEKKKAENNEFRNLLLQDVAREYIVLTNGNRGLNRLELIGQALTRSGTITHGTSDFSNILANVASKAMMMGWIEAEETWAEWCRIGNLSDFKQAYRVNVSEFPDLDEVPAGAEYKYGKMADMKEPIQLRTYGKLFSITRQAIINDDLDAFTRIPRAQARAANRKIGDLAYSRLTANPTLTQDNVALFHSSHNNLKSSGSTAPTVARVNAIRAAMATQRGLLTSAEVATAGLNIRPAHLICPVALEGTAKALVEAQYDPAGSAGTLTPNTVRGTFKVISDPRLDAASATAWYMAANQNLHDTVEVAFLDGNPNPFLEAQEGWTVDGRSFKVRIDVGVAALDYRGLYKDVGTA